MCSVLDVNILLKDIAILSLGNQQVDESWVLAGSYSCDIANQTLVIW